MPQALSVRSPASSSRVAWCSARCRSASLAPSTCMALALFWVWLRWFWQVTTMPVGQVGEAHRRVGLVHVLAAGARRPVGVDAEVLLVDLDLAGHVLQERHHVERGEAGLAAVLGVERRDAHQPVHAPLGGQQPEGVAAAHDERGRHEPGLLALGGLLDLDGEAPALGPPGVHAQHHLGPVLGVGAAGAGVDLGHRVAVVVLPGEQRPQLEDAERRSRSARISSTSGRSDSSPSSCMSSWSVSASDSRSVRRGQQLRGPRSPARGRWSPHGRGRRRPTGPGAEAARSSSARRSARASAPRNRSASASRSASGRGPRRCRPGRPGPSPGRGLSAAISVGAVAELVLLAAAAPARLVAADLLPVRLDDGGLGLARRRSGSAGGELRPAGDRRRPPRSRRGWRWRSGAEAASGGSCALAGWAVAASGLGGSRPRW